MNTQELEGKWMQLKGKAKEQWGKLTDKDLDEIGGKTDQLAGKIQEKYGTTREEAKKQIDEWCKSC